MNTPPLTALRGVGVSFGGRPLFQSVQLHLVAGDKACLVGRNGSGKSTLLKLVAGAVEPDSGERFVQPGTRIAYLDQAPSPQGFTTVQAFVEAGLAAPDDVAQHRVEAAMTRLGLPAEQDPATLSGGWLRRAALARVLAADPDVMLLDEPTNHLDLPTIQWLEETLTAFRGALLLVSHDRRFLTNLSRRTLWLDRGQLRDHPRGFADFDRWQAEVFTEEDRAAARLDKKIASETLWLREGLSARRKRNMGRVRQLQDLREQRAARIAGGQQVALAVAESEKSGRLVIEAESVAKRFATADGPKTVLKPFSTRILRGDRVGVLGPNGSGKTTLVKILTGALPPDEGTVRLGTNLGVAYFDQARESLAPTDRLRDVLCPDGGDTVLVGGRPRHIASYLRDFLFDDGRLDSPVHSLSGGERNRLLLARLFARPSNLLILDEPTNDLDMDTLDLLEDVVGDYQGTLILVSHDRDFLDRLVTSTIALEGDGLAREYPGGYSDYVAQRSSDRNPLPDRSARGESNDKKKKASAKSETPAAPRGKRKLSYREQRELAELPARIETLETEIGDLETQLADPRRLGGDPAALTQAGETLAAKRAELSDAEDRWLELEAMREALNGRS